jgi:hypothetical protein
VHFALVTLLLLLPFSAFAQTFEQTTGQRLHEASMSARSTAMGGASDALTPDGTDLASNPALIASLRQNVVSLSGAQTSYGVLRFSTSPTTFYFDREGRSARTLAHVAAVIPLHAFVIGVYARQEPELRDVANGFPSAIQLDYTPQCIIEPCDYAYAVGATEFEQRDRRYGVTAAFERGPVAFGAGAELQDLSETYDVWRFALPGLGFMERLTHRTTAHKVVPNAGVRWRVTPRVALAAAYNGAAARERNDDVCLGDYTQSNCISTTARLGTTHVNGADAYRASLTVVPIAGLVLVGEGVRRNYAKLGSDPIFGLRYHDVTEVHAGAEYKLRRTPIAIRAGWWREPAKTPVFGFPGSESGTLDHRTVGAGIDVGSSARVDLAYDHADEPSQRRAVVGVAFRTGH